jgi:hypothetical protein
MRAREMSKPLTPDAQLLLMILAANGGSMTRPAAEAEYRRVIALSPADLDAWYAQAANAIAVEIAHRKLNESES